MEGAKLFVVRGIMRPGGLTSAFGGNLAVMDIYAAQKMFGRGRMFDRIDLAVKEGVTIAQGQAALQRVLGPGFEVAPPEARGRNFESILAVYSMVANISSLFALFIGMFIIYNTFAIAVTQRRSEIGILRALGATRGQIRTLFLAESAIGGLIGSSLGVLCGLVAAQGLAAYISSLLEGVYGIAQHAEQVAADPRLVAFALLMGIVTSLLAAWLPARNAARVDPVQALQKGKYQVLSAGDARLRRYGAAACGIVTVLCLALGQTALPFYTGYFVAILGALLITPAAAVWIARILRPLLSRFWPVEGALAADSLIQAPRRTSSTVAALMLSLAQVVGVAGMASASYSGIVEWIDTSLNPDFFVTSSANLTMRAFRFPGAMEEELRGLPGIRDVQPVRSVRMNLAGGPVLLIAVDGASIARSTRQRVIAGDRDEMFARVARGEGVVVSDNLAQMHRVRLGDTLEIPSPSGLLRLPIAGVIVDWSDQQGSVFVDRSVFRERWSDDTVNLFRVYLAPGASAESVKQAIMTRFAASRRLVVMSNQELRAYIMQLADQWMGLTYVQIFVAVMVALLGIVNTLTVSIIDRRRELGVLQAVGALRRQVRHTVWMEAFSVSLIGLALGLALGSLNLFYVLEMTHRDIGGMLLEYRFPVTTALALVPLMLAAGFVSALGPAESAVRGSLVEALEYE
jgi:putative ABC transport system permease protein